MSERRSQRRTRSDGNYAELEDGSPSPNAAPAPRRRRGRRGRSQRQSPSAERRSQRRTRSDGNYAELEDGSPGSPYEEVSPGSPDAAPAPRLEEVNPETPPPNPPVLRRSLRPRSGVALSRSGSANNRHDPEAVALPQIFDFALTEFGPIGGNPRSDVFQVHIDNVEDYHGAQSLMDLIKNRANEPPSQRYHLNETINVEPHAISPLPLYQNGTPVFQKVMLVYLEDQGIVAGFIICGRAPHHNTRQFPPEDHHFPPTTLVYNNFGYTGFGRNGYATPTRTKADSVKEELVACASTQFSGESLVEDIVVRAFRFDSRFVTKLKCRAEDLITGNSAHRIFENNGSIFMIRQRLIEAVGGNHHHYCENDDGGIARFILYPVS